jgi:hypothetical protein
MPMSSVAQLEASSSTSVPATAFWVSPSLLPTRAPSRARNGRTTSSMKTM